MGSLEEFVRECVEVEGGLAEFPEAGMAEAILPPALAEVLGAGDVVSLALAPEALDRQPGAQPLFPGSQELEALIRFAAGHGRLTRAWPRVERLAPRGLAAEIEHAFTFNARRVRPPEAPAEPGVASVARFDFVVGFISDEQEEFLHSMAVDLWAGLSRPALAAAILHAPCDDEGPPEGRRQLSVPQAYAIAEAELPRELAPRVAAHQERISRRLSAETGRLRLYYHALEEDLARRRRPGRDGSSQEELEQRRAAIRAEGERKMQEMSEKYRLCPSAHLAAVRVLIYPRLFTSVTLERRTASRTLEVAFDPLLGRLLPPGCDTCRRETTYLALEADGRLACRRCAAVE